MRARCTIEVGGLSQGVGFRPFVYDLARRLSLHGSVRNHAAVVAIEIEGEKSAIDELLETLRMQAPALAIVRCELSAPRGATEFHIEASEDAGDRGAVVYVPSDRATCDVCLAELSDPANRRAGHPFINCTQCGPRASIIREMPYDRERTSMREHAFCSACASEYANPSDRRFHAQPIACKACGPKLQALDVEGRAIDCSDPVAYAADAIVAGEIVAIKGVGGFHFVCDAAREAVVERLRARKRRDRKPFALLVADLREAAKHVEIDAAATSALRSAERPIVLLKRLAACALPDAIAPGLDTLGVMLPYAPVQHLLLSALRVRGHHAPLIVTSANCSGELLATDERDLLERARGIADHYVTHDRAIELALEDSVVRILALEDPRAARSPRTSIERQLVRRARGYAPLPIELPFEVDAPVLAVGGHQKAVFALAQGRHVVLSPCAGDLDSPDSYHAWSRSIARFERLLRIAPLRMAHDLHPDYASTRYAIERAERERMPRAAVQHHHAHMASCMLEHGLLGPAIGVCFDGTGLGHDGTLWGGEWLVGDYARVERAAHLATLPLVGGDRAAREPWRMALSYACASAAPRSAARIEQTCGVDPASVRSVRALLDRARVGDTTTRLTAQTSSAGRLFDAVASLLCVLHVARYEGEAPMRLEALARRVQEAVGRYSFELAEGAAFAVDVRPMIVEIDRDLARGEAAPLIARRFHDTLAEIVAHVCDRIRARTGVARVVLSGGVFANTLLTGRALERLAARGFETFTHARVPPNDGGLCLGQLAVSVSESRALQKEVA